MTLTYVSKSLKKRREITLTEISWSMDNISSQTVLARKRAQIFRCPYSFIPMAKPVDWENLPILFSLPFHLPARKLKVIFLSLHK